MSISSVGSSNSAAYAASLQHSAAMQNARESVPDKENDGDKDDGVTGAQSSAPTTNMQGQTIGTLINTTA